MQIEESQLEFYEEIWKQIQEGNDFHLNFTLRIMHKLEIIRWIQWLLDSGKEPACICLILDTIYVKGKASLDRLSHKP